MASPILNKNYFAQFWFKKKKRKTLSTRETRVPRAKLHTHSIIGYTISESFSFPSEKEKLRSSLRLEIVARIVSANMYEYWILDMYAWWYYSALYFHFMHPRTFAPITNCVYMLSYFNASEKKHLKHSTHRTEPNRTEPNHTKYRLHLQHIRTTEQWNEIYIWHRNRYPLLTNKGINESKLQSTNKEIAICWKNF